MNRRGVTLVELLVVLAILAVMAGMAGIAMRVRHDDPTESELAMRRVAELRHTAIANGQPVSILVSVSDGARRVTAYPDGRVLGDSLPGIDPLSGRPIMVEEADARP